MGKKILIIDDEEDVRLFLSTVLVRNGYEAVTASNGREGLEVAERERPDLVTLDLLMPMRSGADLYRALHDSDALKDVPVIVISGLAGRELAVPNPVAVFDKPIDPAAFLQAVEQALQRQVDPTTHEDQGA